MIIRFGWPAMLSQSEKEEILYAMSLGGKYIVFEFPPNDRRTDCNRVNTYSYVSEGGNRNLSTVIVGATAIALTALYDDLCLGEVKSIKVASNIGYAHAYLLEDVIKYFTY